MPEVGLKFIIAVFNALGGHVPEVGLYLVSAVVNSLQPCASNLFIIYYVARLAFEPETGLLFTMILFSLTCNCET